jgi:hypothetical protein
MHYKAINGVSIKGDPKFARVKKSGQYHYLQIVENKKVKRKYGVASRLLIMPLSFFTLLRKPHPCSRKFGAAPEFFS